MQEHKCSEFLQKLPKAELHVHIEGTLEPEHLLRIAHKNNVTLPIQKILSDDKTSYRFSDFTSFIATYRAATQALCTEADFYEITFAYLAHVHQQGVVHTEIYFDIQTYLPRNIDPGVVIYGIHKGLLEGFKRFGISGSMILSLLCNETEQQALNTINLAYNKYKNIIQTIGLAAHGAGNPITKFKSIFEYAHEKSFHCVAHVGEFGHPALIWQALRDLPIERIDHGIACASDPELMRELACKKIPLTICPISNVMLGVYKNLQEHPIRKIYDAGVMVTINSDDPAFFKSYVGDNYVALLDTKILTCNELVQCARNSINASFIDQQRKDIVLAKTDEHVMNHICD